jgi:RNA polymerase sigma-70 factor, ECF subfamily
VTIFNATKLLERALTGDQQATGALLENFRPYLHVIAQRQLDERVQRRLDPSDIVQTTFLEAHRDFQQFQGRDINSFLAWLRNILRHNVETEHQTHLTAQKRSAKLEVAATASGDGSSAGPLVNRLASESSTPSQRMMRDEAAAQLASSMFKLPETQAEAIRLRYLEGQSLRYIAQCMEKTELAVAGLLKRGLKALRSEMADSQSSIASLNHFGQDRSSQAAPSNSSSSE